MLLTIIGNLDAIQAHSLMFTRLVIFIHSADPLFLTSVKPRYGYLISV